MHILWVNDVTLVCPLLCDLMYLPTFIACHYPASLPTSKARGGLLRLLSARGGLLLSMGKNTRHDVA